MTIQEILTKGTEILNENKIEEARLIAKLLLSYILRCKKEELIVKLLEDINNKSEQEFLNRNRKNNKRISTSIYNRNKRIYENGIYSQ